MKLQILSIGKLKLPYAKLGCDDYLERLKHFFPVEMRELPDARRSKGGDARSWKAAEAASFRSACDPGCYLVALDERGRSGTSREFAQWLGQRRDAGVRTLTFLIGGPDGIDEALRQDAAAMWCLSALTFPHELARLVLCEQLYRAASILAGSAYHRD